jgi:glutamyl-tRNA synthetase
MEEFSEDRVAAAAERAALINALQHEADAAVGPIMGPLMAEHPSFRAHADAVSRIVADAVAAVNAESMTWRRERLAAIDADALAAIDAPEPTAASHTLPALPEVDGAVRMRAAPNPNGPWHIGHARMPAVIGAYRDRYDGHFILRFDDTDPGTKRPDLGAYAAIEADLAYLGVPPDEVVRASDRMEVYYAHAEELIDAGGAYVCGCTAETFSALKNAGEACPHRTQSTTETHERFAAMVDGAVTAGEAVLRVRTDIEHENPALRDFVAFRMIDRPHPRPVAASYRCWPMLDFQSAIDDQLLGVSHIIRGIDLQDSARRQRFIYGYLGWEYPAVLHWGHVDIDAYDLPLSTSAIGAAVDEGALSGWDDPRAPTLVSLRRRGIDGAAVVETMVELGMSTSNVDLAMSTIYAANRSRVDPTAPRAFLVRDPVRFAVAGLPAHVEVERHPDDPAMGVRTIAITDAVVLEPADVPAEGSRVWLKGAGCVRREAEQLVATDEPIDVVRSGAVDVVHWAPAGGRPVRLETPDGPVSGVAPPPLTAVEEDTVVQFERVGFARIDAQGPSRTVAYFAHR